MPLSMNSLIKLDDGNEIPILGFAAYEMDSREAYESVKWALEAGYRHFEAVEWFENEKAVGKAILNFCHVTGVPRAEIFYATKLKENKGYDHALASIQRAVHECELTHIDLFIIHSPIGGTEARQESWRALVDAQKQGLVKSLGIASFGIKHIQEILSMNMGVPAVHQIELHPFSTREDLVSFTKEHGIVLEAWAPLVHGLRLEHPTIATLAEKYNRLGPHILLRYAVQKGYVPITMSGSQKRLVSNTKIFDFELTQEEMNMLDALDEGFNVYENPVGCE